MVPRSTLPVYRRQAFPDPVLGEKWPAGTTIMETPAVRMWHLGDDVAIVSLKSKANTIGEAVLDGVQAAIERAGGVDDRQRLLDALEQVSVTGANGDQRGFNENNHEGVVDDDVYFARFEGMTYKPVKDDPLSSTLAPLDQRR